MALKVPMRSRRRSVVHCRRCAGTGNTQRSVVANAATKNDLSRVHTVPDPYYVQSKYEVSTDTKVLKFVGLPQDCIIRIYSVSGVLVRVIEHHAADYSSTSLVRGASMIGTCATEIIRW